MKLTGPWTARTPPGHALPDLPRGGNGDGSRAAPRVARGRGPLTRNAYRPEVTALVSRWQAAPHTAAFTQCLFIAIGFVTVVDRAII